MQSERIHSLDALRGIMMILGLVLHSAITYDTMDHGGAWALKDVAATSLTNDFIVGFIHSFRMQIFFLIAGFFAALLFYQRSPKHMIQNRIKRILFPFLVFLLVLWPSIKFGFMYTDMVLQDLPNALSESLNALWSWSSLFPTNTFHLWFLYHLLFITMISLGFAFLFIRLKKLASIINKGFAWLIIRPVARIIFLTICTVLVYYGINTPSVPTSASFIPNFLSISYYLFFYLVGWVLFKSKHHISVFKKWDWINLILGIVLFSFLFIFSDKMSFGEKVWLKSFMVWLLIFGITGLFIRFTSQHSPIMRYVSDASYWVYLSHLSFTAFFPSLLKDLPIPGEIKFLIVMILSGILCFVSYHYLVRGTFIGKFLNGRTYTRKIKST